MLSVSAFGNNNVLSFLVCFSAELDRRVDSC